jgi:hypothetical protein
MTAADRALLEQAVERLRTVVAERPPTGTLHFGLFALARLLEEITRAHGSEGRVPDAVGQAALEIARHVVDHGIAIPPGAAEDRPNHTEQERT